MLALIPFYTLPTIDLGPLKLQPFGMLVAAGVLTASWVGRKRAEQLRLDDDHARILVGYLVVCGFLGAHWFDVLAYQPGAAVKDPLLLLKIWSGISSYGGFLGAFVGFFLFTWRHKIRNKMAWADVTIWGTLPGFTFGRMGCATVHDHPGSLTDFWLGVNFPPDIAPRYGFAPGTRHDLGLYELIFLLGVIAFVFAISRIRKPIGFICGITALLYGPIRFMFEYLRLDKSDPRYSIAGLTPGLTFAQYVSIATVAMGAATIWYIYKKPQWVAEGGGIEGVEPQVYAPPKGAATSSAGAGSSAAKKSSSAKSSSAKSSSKKPGSKKSGGKKSGGKSKKRKK